MKQTCFCTPDSQLVRKDAALWLNGLKTFFVLENDPVSIASEGLLCLKGQLLQNLCRETFDYVSVVYIVEPKIFRTKYLGVPGFKLFVGALVSVWRPYLSQQLYFLWWKQMIVACLPCKVCACLLYCRPAVKLCGEVFQYSSLVSSNFIIKKNNVATAFFQALFCPPKTLFKYHGNFRDRYEIF